MNIGIILTEQSKNPDLNSKQMFWKGFKWEVHAKHHKVGSVHRMGNNSSKLMHCTSVCGFTLQHNLNTLVFCFASQQKVNPAHIRADV